MWDASPPTSQVTEYQVCIGTTALSCNVQLASVNATETQYVFAPAAGTIQHVAIRAVNSAGPGPYSTDASFSIPSFTQPLNQSSPVGVAITPFNVSVSDPDGNALNFTHTGLPTGLAISATTGRVTGTPSAAGTYNVTIFVTDSLVTVSRSFVWTITAPVADTTPPALVISSHTNGQTVSNASVTISGTATDSGRGGNGVSSVTVNGQAATGGTASGSATASWSRALTLAQGANTITVQATDSRGNVATQSITLNYTIAPVTSAALSANLASPQNTGTAVTFTASAAGGVAPRQYKFFVQQAGGAAQVVQNWSTTTTYTWTPATAASYTVIVWARSAGITVDAAQASAQVAYTINTPPPAPVTSVALTSNLATPQNTGTAITFTAVGVGGVAPREYKFLVRQSGGTNQIAQNWSTSATYTWTPSVAASYTVIVWARSAGVTTDAAQALAQIAYVIDTPPVAPVTGATIGSSLASPQMAGTAITFTANGSGGVAPREFKFFVQPSGGAAQVVQNWSTATTYTWTPATAGSYSVVVWARSAGVTVDAAQASAQMAYVVDAPPVAPVTGASLVSNVASPQNVGTAITLVTSGSGGVAPRQFKFFVQPSGGSAQMVRDWSTSTSYVWTPTTAGSYTLIVWARSAGVTVDAAQASAQLAYVVTTPAGPLTITGLTPSVASPQATGTPVTFTAAASGGTSPYSFKWWLFDGTTWTMIRDWSTAATLSWTPAAGGNYRIGIWARDASMTGEVSSVNLSIPYSVTGAAPAPAPAPSPTPTPGTWTITGLTSNLASPQVSGTPVTFTAGATGGQAPYQFKWWVYNGSSWTMVRDWNSSTTYTWTPTSAGTYRIGIWARDSSTTADISSVNLSVPFTVSGAAPAPTPPPAPSPSPSPAGPLALTSLTSSLRSPEVAGTTVTFTAAATGGTAPYQYKWWLFDGVNWTMAANWGTSNTFTWTPLTPGSFRIGVWVRDSTTTADVGNVNLSTPFVVNPASGLSIATIGLSTPVPVAGAAVGLTAFATGGVAPYQFKWWVFDGTTWTMLRDWGASTFTWTPPRAGSYRIGAWVRSAGSTDNSGSVNMSIPVVVQ